MPCMLETRHMMDARLEYLGDEEVKRADRINGLGGSV